MGSGNVLMTDDYVALIDWDEARVDVPAFDDAHLPPDLTSPGDGATVQRAGVAREVATCWLPEPDYARRRLEELRRLAP